MRAAVVPFDYRVRPGNEVDLAQQLRLSRLEELAALRRRALAWAQYGRSCRSTDERIRALEATLNGGGS